LCAKTGTYRGSLSALSDSRLFPPPGYAHVAVASGRSVFTAGAVPIDAEGRLVGAGDVGKQTRQVVSLFSCKPATG